MKGIAYVIAAVLLAIGLGITVIAVQGPPAFYSCRALPRLASSRRGWRSSVASLSGRTSWAPAPRHAVNLTAAQKLLRRIPLRGASPRRTLGD